MKQPSKEALATLAEVHRELAIHEATTDLLIKIQLDKQRKAALKLINEARNHIRKRKKYVLSPTSKLIMLDEIERYCMKWGWMPDSYKRMCRRWKKGEEMHLSEWGKMLGWVDTQDRDTSDGAELKTFSQEHGTQTL